MKKTIIKKNTVGCVFLALMSIVLLLLPAGALGAPLQTNDTRATVSFTDGDLEIGGGSMGGSGLNFTFGEHPIPITRTSYLAQNNDGGMPVNHVLPVEDARYDSGDWHVTVAMTSFGDAPMAPTSSFDAVIKLENAVASNTNTAAGVAGLMVENHISVASGASAVLVMYADDTLSRGLFTATWTNDDVSLNISDAEVLKIGPSGYEATLTWTLSQGPF